MEVRPVQREDFEPLLLFCDLMRRESPAYREATVDPDKLRQLGEAMLAQPDRICGLVAIQEGRLIGMLAGFVSAPYFGPGCLASDLAVFVKPDRRGGVAAAALIGRFEAWARERGAQAVQLGITTGVHQERTAALYQRLGFEPFGIVCRKRLTGGT